MSGVYKGADEQEGVGEVDSWRQVIPFNVT